jgi:hypothetical protein
MLGHTAQDYPALRNMDLDSYVNLGSSGLQGALSWIFVVAVAIKVVTTALGVAAKRSQFFTFARGNANWVSSKLSALIACFAAWALCIEAQDLAGTILFGLLLVIAVIAVAVMGVRRLSLVKGSAS